MSSPFVILHLSDAHFGQPRSSYDVKHVTTPLCEDIATMCQKLGVPNLIIFTGDVVFGTAQTAATLDIQYANATAFLDAVLKALNLAPHQVPLLLVPGNHDVERSTNAFLADKLCTSFTQADVSRLMQDDRQSWNTLLQRQESWMRFARTRPNHPDIVFNDQFNVMSVVNMEHLGKSIACVSLNTSWACTGDGDRGRLWVGKHQYDVALDLASKADLRIVASHHPLHWLVEADHTELKRRVPIDFSLHLHGHDHSSWVIPTTHHLTVEGGASYAGSKKDNEYNWITIDLDSGDVDVFLRKYTDEGSRGWIAYVIPNRTNAEGCFSAKALLQKAATTISQDTARVPTQIGIIPEPQQSHPAPTPPFRMPTSCESFAYALQDKFSFRWEPHDFSQRPTNASIAVYWPVRLRYPNAIHAAQCFAAAGLQQCGCKVNLWLDNLGNKDYDEQHFVARIHKWLKTAGGAPSDLVVRFCDEDMRGKCPEQAWHMIERWLGTQQHPTFDVLRISKIIASAPDGSEVQDAVTIHALKTRKPRRLMTPAIVWACLHHLTQERKADSIITLGGFDERELWEAWHHCCDAESKPIALGNLYLPELRSANATLKMENKPLKWYSQQDVLQDFQEAVADGATMLSTDRLPRWASSNCALLPALLSSQSSGLLVQGLSANMPDDLSHLQVPQCLDGLAKGVWKWLS